MQSFFNEYLDEENLKTLGPAEREELLKKMKKDLGLVKNKIPSLGKLLDKVAEESEFYLEAPKTGKTLPPKEFWGPSMIYNRMAERVAMLDCMLRDTNKVRRQMENFEINQLKKENPELAERFLKMDRKQIEMLFERGEKLDKEQMEINQKLKKLLDV